MARKRTIPDDALPADVIGDDPAVDVQRPPAEVLYADELARLADADAGKPRPKGWKLTPHVGGAASSSATTRSASQPKFVGKRSFVERCVVALATNRGLMLIGEPGTAKS